jgi:hypothetical protein
MSWNQASRTTRAERPSAAATAAKASARSTANSSARSRTRPHHALRPASRSPRAGLTNRPPSLVAPPTAPAPRRGSPGGSLRRRPRRCSWSTSALPPSRRARGRQLSRPAPAAWNGRIPRGFIKAVALATGGHPDTVATGVRELEGGAEPAGRVRAPGGGRKPATENDPGLGPALRALVDPQSRGDPVVAGKIPRAIGTGRRCVEPGHRPSSGEGKLWAAGEPERAEQRWPTPSSTRTAGPRC